MLGVRDLSVRFAAGTAVREASFALAPGERLGIAGESGSGKTLLGLSLLGMTPEAARVEGSIRLDGTELVGLPERNLRALRGRKVSMVFQEPLSALNPLRRVGDTLAEPLRVHMGLSRARAHVRAGALLEEVGIDAPGRRLRQFPHELSGGQRQRVLIALALTCDPRLLIADEPTTALDAQVATRILKLIGDISDRRGMAVILISHDLHAIARVTARLMVLYGGDIVETGPTRQVLDRPRHPYTAGLIAARPVLDPARDRSTPLPTIAGTVPPLARLPAGCRFAGRCALERPECAASRPAMMEVASDRSAACFALAPDKAVEGVA